MEAVQLHVVDYIMMGIFLLIFLAIGIYYGFYKKQRTTEEYLVGNRQMHLLPVALSLIMTYQSAASVLGIPAEIYIYNSMIMFVGLGISFAYVIQAVVIVPLVYPMRLTTAYEYLGRRYRSRSVHLFGALIGMLQTLLYMGIVLFSPALALEAVAGVPLWISIIIIGAIGTIYTSVGGIKSVVWTDTIQSLILYGGLAVVLILGTKEVGSFKKVMKIANEDDRVNFSSVSFDPRVRHTVWSLVIGGMFGWLPNCCNQTAIQRICSMRNIKESRIAVLLNIPMTFFFLTILTLVGFMLYAYYRAQECDPVGVGFINNPNQMMPFFIMHVFNKLPGLAGLFVAILFSGALSSLSSGINALSANIVQDILVARIHDKSQVTKTLIAKITVCIFGVVTVGLAYLARGLSGPVTQMAQTAMGACGGPVTGIIFLGAIFPQANWIGALTGGTVAIGVNIWWALSTLIYGSKAPKSEPITIVGCFRNATEEIATNISTNGRLYTTEMASLQTSSATSLSPVAPYDHPAIYDISYMYFGMIGFFVAIVVGLTVSLLTGKDKEHPTDLVYIFPFLRKFWNPDYKSPTSIDPVDTKHRDVELDVELDILEEAKLIQTDNDNDKHD